MARKGLGVALLLALVLSIGFGTLQAQESAQPPAAPVTTETAVNQALTFIDSVSSYLGQGVLYLLNLITNDRVSSDLERPIGYLAFITVLLLLFGLIDFARKIIWIGVIVGWVLLIVRVILDALGR